MGAKTRKVEIYDTRKCNITFSLDGIFVDRFKNTIILYTLVKMTLRKLLFIV